MKRLHIILVAATVLLLATGCNKEARRDRLRQKVRIESIEGVSGNMDDGWSVRLLIRNTTGYKPTLTACDGTIYVGERKVAHLRLLDEVQIPKRTESAEITLPVAVTLSNPLAALALVGAVRKGNYDGIDISLALQIRVMSANRTVNVERMPLRKFLDNVVGSRKTEKQ